MPSAPARIEVDLRSEDDRYHRQTLITWWDQQRLADATVLVVGAGALGNELVKNLVLLGVGTVLVVDLDRVENSNLSRCVLFREQDEGAPKATVVAARARELNPECRVIPIVGDVRFEVGLAVFKDVDVVIGGLDNREARLFVNQACWKSGTPWIDGAIEGLLGIMRTFVPPEPPCYECTLNEVDHRILAARKACSLLSRDQMLEGKVPTTATSASAVAALQAQEAIKLLHRDIVPYDFAGRGFAMNGMTHDSYVVSYGPREDCMSHDTYDLDAATTVSPETTFRELLGSASMSGGETSLEFEHEIVLAFSCPQCGATDDVRQPLGGVRAAAALCPSCGGQRSPRLAHAVTRDDEDLLGLRPRDLGLAPFDVVTARVGFERKHFIVGPEGASIDWLEAHAA